VPAGEVLGHLGALVDKSLVQFDDTPASPGRYRLLETVRQYAAGRLDALGPALAGGARIAHRDYYLALAEAAAPQLVAADQAAWLDRLDAELGNLRAAVAVSLAQPDPEPGLRLAAALSDFWQVRGHAIEGADVLRAFLDAPAAQGATLPRARALAAAARLLEKTDGYAIGGSYCEEALGIARAAGDEPLVAEALFERAWVMLRQGQPGAARPLIESGLSLAHRLGDPHLTARVLSTRLYATCIDGDPADATQDAVEAVRLFRQAGDRLKAGAILGNLGYVQLSAGNLNAARGYLTEALDIARALDDRDGIVYGSLNLGLAHYLDGSLDAAGALFAESLGLARRMGMKRQVAYPLIGLALAGHGGASRGWAARLHGAADQALAELGETIDPLEGRLADLDRQRLRTVMGDAAFEAEYTAGRTLDLAGVAQEALQRVRARRAAQQAVASVSEPRPAGSQESVTILTPRELDVLKLVAQGLSNPDIAQRLLLSEHTVHRHLANIRRKLHLSSRAAAAAWGVRAGLV
jgi:DNA-binding CsgD family transcriptional regulator/tetratricopeptide (TPR) repeat protein